MRELPNQRAEHNGHIPELPHIGFDSPKVVLVCDRIRRELDERDGFEEFCWFIREYPRCYRFHMDAAQFRLKSVHGLMGSLHSDLVQHVSASNAETFESGIFDTRVQQLYWDFESFLSETAIAIDLLARVVGPA